MRIKLCILLGVLLLISLNALSQNTLQVNYSEVNYDEEVSVSISLNNSDLISALQFDLTYKADALILMTGHQKTDRGANHTLGVSSPSSGVIRVLIYSESNANLANSSGDLLTLKMKSLKIPGYLNLEFSNIVASSASGSSVEVGSQSGTITILGPYLGSIDSVVDMGRVTLNSTHPDVLHIENWGTAPLILTSVNDISPFSIVDDFPITIPQHTDRDIIIEVDGSEVGSKSVELTFQNNDPDSIRTINLVKLKAEVYIANELWVGNGNGNSNEEIEIPVEIRNSEDFTGFQFDIRLPHGIYYVDNSIVTTDRLADHSIAANKIEGENGIDTLRIIGYSISNKNFIGNSGDVFSFKIISTLFTGFHVLVVENAIITNTDQENILSDFVYGSLSINSPVLTVNNSLIDFGTVSFTETAEQSFIISNTGVAPLIIDSVSQNSGDLSFDFSLPLSISADASKQVTISYKPSSRDDFNDTLVFHDNDPADHSIFSLTAKVLMPNYLKVANVYYFTGQDVWVDILVENYEPFVALQFDLSFPSSVFTYVADSAMLTSRFSDHELLAVETQSGKLRVLVYSLSQATASGEEGSVLRLKFTQNSDTEGVFDFILSKQIVINSNSEDILYGIENGQVEIFIYSVGIEDELSRDISIYPNPASTKIRIEFGDNSIQIKKILLFDSYGTLVLNIASQSLRNNIIEIPCNNYSPGIYYLQIHTDKKSFTKKISIID